MYAAHDFGVIRKLADFAKWFDVNVPQQIDSNFDPLFKLSNKGGA